LFAKNEAAAKLDAAIRGVIFHQHGSLRLDASGCTAMALTTNGARLEAHEGWGQHGYHGGAAAVIAAAAAKLEHKAARWGVGTVAYPRFMIEKTRGKKEWRAGVADKAGSWRHLATVGSVAEAFRVGGAEAARLGVTYIREDRPRRLW